MISGYNNAYKGAEFKNIMKIIGSGLTISGFLVFQYEKEVCSPLIFASCSLRRSLTSFVSLSVPRGVLQGLPRQARFRRVQVPRAHPQRTRGNSSRIRRHARRRERGKGRRSSRLEHHLALSYLIYHLHTHISIDEISTDSDQAAKREGDNQRSCE